MKPWTCKKLCTLLVFGTAALVLVLHPIAAPAAEKRAGVSGLKIDMDPLASTPVQKKLFTTRAAADSCSTESLPWRGALIGADPYTLPTDVHHFNIYARINDGPLLYLSTVPAYLSGSLLDPGLRGHFFTRGGTAYSLYATASYEGCCESALSDPAPLVSCYPTNGCTEQTVPVAVSGPDQVVKVGTEVTLDASGSYDPYSGDNATLNYAWRCYSAPMTAETLILTPDSTNPKLTRFTPTATGSYYFRLVVLDTVNGVDTFNRSNIAYVRVRVVDDPADPNLVVADAGPPQLVPVGTTVTLDASRSLPLSGAIYQWVQSNPVGTTELSSLASSLGTVGCYENCFKGNFDSDNDVDGKDIALIANNWGPAILNSTPPTATFIPGLPRPYIFRLTVSNGTDSSSETTIISAYNLNAAEMNTPPPVDGSCLQSPM